MTLQFRSKIQNKVLNYFFLHSKESVYINELARIIKSDPKNVYRILCRLQDQGILASEFKGKQRYFYLNHHNPLTQHYRQIFLKTAGVEHILARQLNKLKGVEQAHIFGSYASGNMDEYSDIDLLVVADTNVVEVQKAISSIEPLIGRDIHPVIFSIEGYRKKKATDPLIRAMNKNKTIQII